MPSSFMGLETALRGIRAQQLALNTTSHNIANADTAGYTRQVANQVASQPFTEPSVNREAAAGQIGTGVTVADYARVRDAFIDIQLRAQTMREGAAAATKDGLEQVELALNEPSENGLSTLLSEYWAGWQDVSNAPENLATRQALAQSAASLAEGFRGLSAQLDTIGRQTALNVGYTLADVNSIGREVALLNDAISRSVLVGDAPNDLLDQRDVLLDRLSQLGNTSITAGPLGTVDVTIGGAALVTATSSAALAETDLTSLTSGKLKGLVDLRDTTLPAYRADLDTVAAAIITQTNTLHAAGRDLSGAAGVAFFTGTDAATIRVNAALLASPSLVAASANGEPGNAANALAIANLSRTAVIGSATVDAAYSQLVTRIGSDSKEATRTLENAQLLAGALEDRRQSVSGVSLDEEMTNLVRFQRGYQASSRAMSAIDSMLETLITRTGRVGL